MLILAGASLNVLVGQNGILRKAQEAVVAYKDAEEKEQMQMAYFGGSLAGITKYETNSEKHDAIKENLGMECRFK